MNNENMNNENKEKISMHIVSLALGIISIVTSFFWYVTLPTGILAIIFGIKSIKKTGSKIAKAGLITGIVGLSLFALCYIGMILIIVLENSL